MNYVLNRGVGRRESDQMKDQGRAKKPSKLTNYLTRIAVTLVLLAIFLYLVALINVLNGGRSVGQVATEEAKVTATTIQADAIEHTGQATAFMTLEVESVIAKFKADGLEVANARMMTGDDFGLAPKEAVDAVRFYMPALGEGVSGRIYSFDDEADLQDTQRYYRNMGSISDSLANWTIRRDNILVQLDGQVTEEQVRKYEASLKTLK